MADIEWTSDLDTGIAVIDEQHRRIVDYINRLGSAIGVRDQVEIAGIFDELVDYTLTHFTFEEGLQEQAGYRFASAHKRVHEVFAKKLAEHREAFAQGEMGAARRTHGMLVRWLVNHIRNDDADYVPSVAAVATGPATGGWMGRALERLFGR